MQDTLITVGSDYTQAEAYVEGLDKINQPVCYLVIPCYNEEEVLPETSKRLSKKLGKMIETGCVHSSSKVLFVDDGSKDSTWSIIKDLAMSDHLFSGIKLAHNRGHQNALYAGLMYVVSRCDISISLDADLQDDIEVLDAFVERYKEGCQVVYGVRQERSTDTAFKRQTAGFFYRLMRALGTEVVDNHADYRLLSKSALVALSLYQEVNLFLRGIVTDIGFKTGIVYYSRAERFAGESKYPIKKMITLAADGITSFSVKPLRMMLSAGIVISAISCIGLLYALFSAIFGASVSGWTTTVLAISFFGGIQVFCLGVLGEYVGKTYSETKRRPKYVIEEETLND